MYWPTIEITALRDKRPIISLPKCSDKPHVKSKVCNGRFIKSFHLDLPLHSDAEERDEVHDEDGPEDRDVEEVEERAHERDHRRLRR
jgi:hypothetical protein